MTQQEVNRLREALARAGERRLIWLEGEEADCIARAQSLLGETVFWLGAGPEHYAPQPAAKALQRLGQECDTLVFNAFGDSFSFSPAIRHYFISGTVSGDTGWNNSVMYATPSLGGLSATATIAAGEGNGGRNSAFSAMYFGGPVGLGFAWQKAKMGAAVDDTTSWQLGGSFNFSPVKLYAQYGKVDNDTTGNSFKITGLGADYAVTSAGKLMLQWGKVSPDVGAGRTTTTLGYGHQVSKRTDLYAAYMSDRQTGKTNGTAYAVGVRHRF